MAIRADRLHALLGDVQTHLPEAIDGEADITPHLRLLGMTRAVVRATVEPPMVEVRLITGRQPTQTHQRVLTEWGERLTEPHATDPQAAAGARVESIQVYTMTDEAAASLRLRSTTQRLVGEAHHAGMDDATFAESAIAGVVAGMTGAAEVTAEPARAA